MDQLFDKVVNNVFDRAFKASRHHRRAEEQEGSLHMDLDGTTLGKAGSPDTLSGQAIGGGKYCLWQKKPRKRVSGTRFPDDFLIMK